MEKNVKHEEKRKGQFAVLFLAVLMLLGASDLFQPAAAEAAASPVGVVSYQYLLDHHPDTPKMQAVYEAAIKQAQDEFNAKSPNMSEEEKGKYRLQLEQGLFQKRMELLRGIMEKVNVSIKKVADANGLTVVADRAAIPYGGTDITEAVQKSFK